MVERNETPWAFRPPKSAENREKAVAIAKAKAVSFNALVASYVVEGIERDWELLERRSLQAFGVAGDGVTDDTEAVKRALAHGATLKSGRHLLTTTVLQRSDVSPNLKGKK